jgi:predicted SAM-dependent methyltransferase
MNSKLPYLNLGCGFHYHKDWTNIDFNKTGDDVIPYNLTKGIPAEDESFEVVYHSHVLEHFSKEGGKVFINECSRVLKKNGIIRVAVPDLEKIVENYRSILFQLKSNPDDKYLQANYDWTLLEMYDQTVRNRSGGNMHEYISQPEIINRDFLIERNGHEVESIMQRLSTADTVSESTVTSPFFSKLKHFLTQGSLPQNIKQLMIRKVLGSEYKTYQIGKFRVSGEVHQWMYDQYSLGKLLKETGFSQIEVQTAKTSKIKDWESFGLEITDNKVRKPDSLFIEGRKA